MHVLCPFFFLRIHLRVYHQVTYASVDPGFLIEGLTLNHHPSIPHPPPPSPRYFLSDSKCFSSNKKKQHTHNQIKNPETLINKQIEKEKLSNFPRGRVVVVRVSNAYFSEAYNFLYVNIFAILRMYSRLLIDINSLYCVHL